MLLLEGPFLLIGILACVAAVVIGVGAWFDAWRWQERWALAGGLAGMGVFELYLYAHGGMLPVLIPSARYVVVATAALFVCCGIAAAYGTLFPPSTLARPVLPEGTAEERLWYLDAIDRIRPERTDWLLTVGMLAPCLGMVYLGTTVVTGPGLALAGAMAGLGPIYAGVGLFLRAGTARQLDQQLVESEERRALTDAAGSGR